MNYKESIEKHNKEYSKSLEIVARNKTSKDFKIEYIGGDSYKTKVTLGTKEMVYTDYGSPNDLMDNIKRDFN